MKHQKWRFFLALLCLGLTMTMVGVSYARYEQTIVDPTSLFMEGEPLSEVYLHGQVDDQWLEKNTLPELESAWSANSTGAEMAFSVTNFTAAESGGFTEAAARDQQFRLQLVAGLSIGKPENLNVTLILEENIPPVTDEYGYTLQAESVKRTEYQGTAQRIGAGTPLYHDFGHGWVYRFRDKDTGEEVVFDLPGGTQQYRNFLIQISGQIPQSLLTVQAVGSYSD